MPLLTVIEVSNVKFHLIIAAAAAITISVALGRTVAAAVVVVVAAVGGARSAAGTFTIGHVICCWCCGVGMLCKKIVWVSREFLVFILGGAQRMQGSCWSLVVASLVCYAVIVV